MGRLPLEGYRVCDFGWVFAGAVLGQVFADMGAEVIKVESRKRLDGLRLGRVFELGETLELNPSFHMLNRSKRSVTIDMSAPEGFELLKKLIAVSDLVVDNFRAGVLKRHGLDYESLRKIRPDVVQISMSPAGQTGPLNNILAYAPIMGALAGVDSLMGYYGERPLGVKHVNLDPVSSLFGAFCALTALNHRQETGQGQYIDLSEQEVGIQFIGEAVMEYVMTGRVPGTQGTRHPAMCPHGNYPCKGDDEWIAIAVKTEEEWKALCKAMGNPPWAEEEKFRDQPSRLQHVAEIDTHMAEWTSRFSSGELFNSLQSVGVAATPSYSIEGVFFDPHFKEREVYQEVEHPKTGNEFLYTTPIRFNETPGRTWRHAPLLGQDNNYVLEEVLGVDNKELERLVESQVVY